MFRYVLRGEIGLRNEGDHRAVNKDFGLSSRVFNGHKADSTVPHPTCSNTLNHIHLHKPPSLLWVLRVYKLPGTYENILGGKEGVCMFLSLSSPPEGSARNPEQLQKFVWEKGGEVREVGIYSGKKHP